MTEMLLRSILLAMDEWHSFNSKANGLDAMTENVRQGFRAGGRAPRGYRLEYSSTGAIRDGSLERAALVTELSRHRERAALAKTAFQISEADVCVALRGVPDS